MTKNRQHNFIILVHVIAACMCLHRNEVYAFTPKAPPNRPMRTKESTKRNFIEEAQNSFVGAFTERRLKDYQRKGIPIASSFIPKTYESHPLFRNQHFQTIFGVFVRDSPGCAYIEKSNIISEIFPVGKAIIEALPAILGIGEGEEKCDYWDKRERFETPDGDFFDVDYKFQDPEIGGASGKATVMIIHGLESNSNSSLCINMARAYTERGMDVACVNFRGCSGVPNDTLLQYHAGFTDDLIVFLEKWAERSNRSPLYVTGFSLGANVVMKLLGDLSIQAVDKYNIRGAAVSGAPFDLNSHWRQLIDVDFNRIIYAGSLMKSMKNVRVMFSVHLHFTFFQSLSLTLQRPSFLLEKKVEIITEKYLDGNKDTDVFDYWKAINAKNIPEMEDAMIAPLYGFKDKFDYYDQSASLPVVDSIAVPTYVLNAADDPFFNPDSFPFEKDCTYENAGAPIKLSRTEHGGHLGHLFHRVDKESTFDKRVASFAPMELARFLDHVHMNLD